MPVGLIKKTTYTHVFEYTNVENETRFGMQTQLSVSKHGYQTQFWVGKSEFTYWLDYEDSNKQNDFEALWTIWGVNPGVHVMQTAILDTCAFQVSMDGNQPHSPKKDCTGFENARHHAVDDPESTAPLIVHEIHVTNSENPSLLFNQGSDFIAPQAGLFDGGSAVWDGEASKM
ncbi:uncharacterized protein LOC135400460 [Ornithodoros turicata]|uniref:uncharacterized protein LOC135400460 n=1 Tax=Ornithodoros turicata TaxID=34597 RepID=UPI0031386DFB